MNPFKFRTMSGPETSSWRMTVKPSAFKSVCLALFVLIVMVRLPMAWVQGRFLGEEGTVFFAYAWHHSAGDALWRSFGGYLNLGANAFTLLSCCCLGGPNGWKNGGL